MNINGLTTNFLFEMLNFKGSEPAQSNLPTSLNLPQLPEVEVQLTTLVKDVEQIINKQDSLMKSLPPAEKSLVQNIMEPELAPMNFTEMVKQPRIIGSELLCLANELEKDPKASQESVKTVKRLATLMSKFELSGTISPKGELSASYSLPLYFEPNHSPYPAFVQIQQQQEKNSDSETLRKDTWLRFCLQTEHIGIVTLIFHVDFDNHLAIRIYFDKRSDAEKFGNFLPGLTETLGKTTFTVDSIIAGGHNG